MYYLFIFYLFFNKFSSGQFPYHVSVCRLQNHWCKTLPHTSHQYTVISGIFVPHSVDFQDGLRHFCPFVHIFTFQETSWRFILLFGFFKWFYHWSAIWFYHWYYMLFIWSFFFLFFPKKLKMNARSQTFELVSSIKYFEICN